MSKATEAMRRHNTKHGHAIIGKLSAEYQAWAGMVSRCQAKQGTKEYRLYVKADVRVCPRWRTDFQAFLRDVGPRPSPQHSIDRFPNNGGNYEPNNVRWATRQEQNRNRRNSRYLTINGVRKRVVEWHDDSGTPLTLIYQRLRVLGWSPERAVWTPRRSQLLHCPSGHFLTVRRGVRRCWVCKRASDAQYRAWKRGER